MRGGEKYSLLLNVLILKCSCGVFPQGKLHRSVLTVLGLSPNCSPVS